MNDHGDNVLNSNFQDVLGCDIPKYVQSNNNYG